MADKDLEFGLVYAEFYPKIYRYLKRLVGETDAEDLTQDVFIKVAKALVEFKNQSRLSTWIYQIATNTAIDRMRSSSFKQETDSLNSIGSDLNDKELISSKKYGSVDEQVIRKEMNECINGYILSLPQQYQAILLLSEVEGFKNAEIAEILNISLSTVKIRLHRAKEKLKKVLLENCNFYRTECCGKLACEQKEPPQKNLKSFNKKKAPTQ